MRIECVEAFDNEVSSEEEAASGDLACCESAPGRSMLAKTPVFMKAMLSHMGELMEEFRRLEKES